MKKALVLLLLILSGLGATALPARAQQDQQQVVSTALTTLERMKKDTNFQKDFQPRLSAAKGALIVPTLFKAGFILGGQYGNGVLLVRRADGSWSYPAFYTMSGGSLGLQIGAAGSSILFIIMTDKGLQAMMNDQFKFGADAGVTFFVVGAGVGGSSTSAMGADILAFSLSGVGLYGGVSLEGTSVAPRESWNAAYYGQNVAARAIVLDGQVSNPSADPLRDMLSR